MNDISIDVAMNYCHKNGLYPRLEEHDEAVRRIERAKVLDEFIMWLYQRRAISFHEKQYMKEWFLADKLKEQSNK